MKVGYFVETPVEHNLTGGSRSFLNFVDVLKTKGVEPFVVISEEWALTDKLKELGIPYLCSKMYRPFVGVKEKAKFFRTKYQIKKILNERAKRKATKWFRSNEVQLIHINSQFAGIVGAQVARKLKIPYVYHLREYLDEDFGLQFYSDSLVKRYIVPANRIIAISKSIQQYYEKKFSRPLSLIYNGLPVNKDTIVDYRRRFDQDTINLVIVGRVTETKGQFDGVQALNILVHKFNYKNIKLNIVGYLGKDPYELSIMDYIKHNQLDDYVVLHPFMNRPLDVSGQCDIGLMCSVAEAFGRVTVEYMLASLLVIGANSGGTPEVISVGESGLLFEQGNPDSLAEKIKWVIDNREAANAMIKNGQERALNVFSINATVDNIYRTYLNVLKNQKQ